MSDQLHPEGIFVAKVLDHGFDKTTKKGTLYFWVDFETEAGLVQGEFYLSGRAIEKSMEKIANLGHQGEINDPALADGSALRGKEAQITVEHDEYEGRTRARVGFVNLPGSPMPRQHNPEAQAAVGSLAGEWKQALLKADIERKRIEDEADDVPF